MHSHSRRHNRSSSMFTQGVRYEVAADVLGAMISHYAEALAIERGKQDADHAVIALHQRAQREFRDRRADLDPHDDAAIEAVIARYGPRVQALFSPSTEAVQATRRAQFAQANASLALEGLSVAADDLAIQERVIRGEISADEAVALLRRKAAEAA